MTPFLPFSPYNAVALSPFKTSIERMSEGFRFLIASSDPISPFII